MTERGFQVRLTRCGPSRTVRISDPDSNPYAEVAIDDDGYLEWSLFLPAGRKLDPVKIVGMICTALLTDLTLKEDGRGTMREHATDISDTEPKKEHRR
jgi:hypothetical protein